MIVTLRGDFYGECLRLPELAQLLERGTFPLAVPRTVSLHDMLARPAQRANLAFDDGLIQRILDDTGSEPGSLALMAYTLDELYHAGRCHETLSQVKYRELGGVQGAIGKRSEAIFQELDKRAQAALPMVFRELVEVDDRGTATRRRETLDRVATSAAAKRFIDRMTEARLLVQSRGDRNAAFVEVAHEALLRSWSRLADWIDEIQDDLRTLRQVRIAALEWDRNGRAEGFLWPHERLHPVYRMQKNLNVKFDDVTQDFVQPELERLQKEFASNSTKPHRRLAIIERFAQIGGKEAISSLIETLKYSYAENVRINAARALGGLRAREAVGPIISMRIGNIKNQASRATVLGKIGDSEAVPFLIKELRGRSSYPWGTFSEVRRAAAVALGNIASLDAIPELKDAISSDRNSMVVSAAERAVKRIERSHKFRKR